MRVIVKPSGTSKNCYLVFIFLFMSCNVWSNHTAKYIIYPKNQEKFDLELQISQIADYQVNAEGLINY